jgi:voltage-gated potassium channel Kch
MQPFGSRIRNLLLGVIYMVVVMVLATAAYVAAGWSLSDALYMVIITIYTVGYDEVRPIDSGLLRGITITTVVLGCTGMIYLTGALVQFITIGQLESIFGSRRMQNQIAKLKDHIIICGFGRIGQMLAQELKAGGAQFVVIERDEQRVEQARNLGLLCFQEDATDEVALKTAGVARARVLATVLPDDAANVFITLSARSLNREVEVIARGEAASTEKKLLNAGANRVILPAHIGAERIAEMILYPETGDLVRGAADRALNVEKSLQLLGLRVETVVAEPDDAITGRTIEEIERKGDGSFLIVRINHSDGRTVNRPAGNLRVEAGDGVVAVGRDDMTSFFAFSEG